jgi:hypothetical protein
VRWLKRILKGKLPVQSDKLGPWCLLEDYGGIWDVEAYGSRRAMVSLALDQPHRVVLPVCLICDETVIDCDCKEGDFER